MTMTMYSPAEIAEIYRDAITDPTEWLSGWVGAEAASAPGVDAVVVLNSLVRKLAQDVEPLAGRPATVAAAVVELVDMTLRRGTGVRAALWVERPVREQIAAGQRIG